VIKVKDDSFGGSGSFSVLTESQILSFSSGSGLGSNIILEGLDGIGRRKGDLCLFFAGSVEDSDFERFLRHEKKMYK